jgi:hypothetical protein
LFSHFVLLDEGASIGPQYLPDAGGNLTDGKYGWDYFFDALYRFVALCTF